MKRIILNFRGGFPPLREGFEALGHEVVENQWTPEAAALEGAALCVADFVDCARKVGRTRALKKRLARAGTPLVALNRDAPFNRGVHPMQARVVAEHHRLKFGLTAVTGEITVIHLRFDRIRQN